MHPRQPDQRLPASAAELEFVEQPELSTAFMLTGAHRATVPSQWRYPRHDHPYFELCLMQHGEQQVRLTGRTLTQHTGELLLLTPFEAHAASTPAQARFCCLHFDVDDIELRRLLCLAGTQVFRAAAQVTREAGPLVAALASPLGDADIPPLAARLHAGAQVLSLCSALAGSAELAPHRQVDVPQTALQTARRLAALIEREVEEGVCETRLEAAIRRLGYAPDYGNAMFRQVYGMSAQHYRSTCKLRRAKLLLLDAGLSIAQVSEHMGYASCAHFSRQFKRWAGVSPAAFRRARGVVGEASLSV
jgi:AraC-like DNA-binding protein